MSESTSTETVRPGGPAITLAEIIAALSFALDMTEGARPGHSVRSCLLGMRLGRQIGLAENELSELYYALLLKDIGCSSNSARMAGVFASDDRMVKRNFKFIDWEKLGKPNREALGFVWRNTLPTGNFLQRLRQVYRMVRAPGDLTAEVIETRCERGAAILFKLGMGVGTCAAVYSLDEHWNGKGLPDRLAGPDIPVLGQICAVAQHLDLFCSEFGPQRAMDTLLQRSGSWFAPKVVLAAKSLHKEGRLWQHCLPDSDAEARQAAIIALQPRSERPLTGDSVDLICSGFADVVDAKSPFTFRHSIGTTETAGLICKVMGLSPERTDVVRRAAMLHDIGMLGVPNTILDKPGPLTADEWAVVREHPKVSRQILSRVAAFADIALLAGSHHERLDSSGYPARVGEEHLSLESRILSAADVFTALMESRPYRQDLSPAKVQQQLAECVPHKLDANCVDAVLSVLDQLGEVAIADVPGTGSDPLPEAIPETPALRFLPSRA